MYNIPRVRDDDDESEFSLRAFVERPDANFAWSEILRLAASRKEDAIVRNSALDVLGAYAPFCLAHNFIKAIEEVLEDTTCRKSVLIVASRSAEVRNTYR